MRIQHNIAALNSWRQLGTNQSNSSKNLEKLSSGYRINRAGDDAAGLAISEKMRAQVRGLDMASKNAQDGVSLIQTAEGALNETHSILQRMRELAVQSSNGIYDDDVDRDNLDKEVTALKSELDRIATATDFNGIKLLDGSKSTKASDVPITNTPGSNGAAAGATQTDLTGTDAVKSNPAQAGGKTSGITKDTTVVTGLAGLEDKQNLDGTEKTLDANFFKAAEVAAGTTTGAEELDYNGFTEITIDVAELTDADLKAAIDKAKGGGATPADATAANKALIDYLDGAKLTIGGTTYTLKNGSSSGNDIDISTLSGTNGATYADDINKALADAIAAKIDAADGMAASSTGHDTSSAGADRVVNRDGTVAGGTTGKPTGVTDISTTGTNDGIIRVQYNSAIKNEIPKFELAGGKTQPNATLQVKQGVLDNIAEGTTVGIKSSLNATEEKFVFVDAGFTEPTAPPANTTYIKLAGLKNGTYSKEDAASALQAAIKDKLGTLVDGNKKNGEITVTADTLTWTKGTDDTSEFVPKFNLYQPGGSEKAEGRMDTKLTFTANDDLKAGSTIQIGNDIYELVNTGDDVSDPTNKKINISDFANANTVASEVAAQLKDAGVNLTTKNNTVTLVGTNGAQVTLKGAAQEANTTIAFKDTVANDTRLTLGGKTYGIFATQEEADAFTAAGTGVGVKANTLGKADVVNALKAAIQNNSSIEEYNKYTFDSANGKINYAADLSKSTKVLVENSAAVNAQAQTTTMDFTAGAKAGSSITVDGKIYELVEAGKQAKTQGAIAVELSADKFVKQQGEGLGTASGKDAADAFAAAINAEIAKNESGNHLDNAAVDTNGVMTLTGKITGDTAEEFTATASAELAEGTSGLGITFQIGANGKADQRVTLNIDNMSSEGLGVDVISIGMQDKANDAIDVINTAINKVSSTRADLGALQNRLEHTINNLNVNSENLTAAESRIRDVDMAKEMMDFTKNNILSQAAQAMLAQANQQPQGVLQLLQ